MEFQYLTDSALDTPVDFLAIAVHEGELKDALVKSADERMGGLLTRTAQDQEFVGKLGQMVVVPTRGEIAPRYVCLLGTGARGSYDSSLPREVVVTALRAGRRINAKKVAVVVPPVSSKQSSASLQQATIGAVLGAYQFDRYRSEEQAKPNPLESVSLGVERNPKKAGADAATKKAARTALERGAIIGKAICRARDLVNEPAAVLTPSSLADEARKVAKEAGLAIKVFGTKECEKLGMGMFLAVGKGSEQEGKLIHLTYTPKGKAQKKVCLIGKGITFDSGGYSLKTSQGMEEMKTDMGGAAAVISAIGTLAQLGCKYEVHAVAACCENLVSGRAYKLGDVLRAMDGTTVEINNTDAEGRLTLGDALTYAREKIAPDEIIDFATLTGACVIALGPFTAGVWGDNEALVKRFLDAAAAAGEDVWRMPLTPKLRDNLKSPIADLRNTGDRHGAATTAAHFLRHFAKDTPWVHVDIAGPATTSRDTANMLRGGTGFGVASILEYLTGG